MVNQFLLDRVIKEAIIEDLNNGDVTTDHLIEDHHISTARMTAKASGVISGIFVAKRIFELLDGECVFNPLVSDGTFVEKGTDILELKGSTQTILKGERLALNFIQRMSGISTLAYEYKQLVKDYDVRIVDTRKTTPNLRFLEKAAVRLGGCHNHRYNLSDAVMIKDNHILAAGGIKKAVDRIRSKVSHTIKIEVEVQNLEMLKAALEAKADIIMLDNMSPEIMTEAVKMNQGQSILEASGGINAKSIVSVAKTGVDVISIGALTHSYQSLDISLNLV